MDQIINLLAHHGYIILFLAVLAEAIGLPIPAALAMIAAGAAGASGMLSGPVVFAICIGAMILGDLTVYFFGRRMGWWLLGFLCRVSMNPETCILRSAESFYKRGRTTLVFSKFIPGISTMAAPMAGSMKMRIGEFLLYDFAGSALYTLVYAGIGYVFHDFVSIIARGFQAAGHAVEIVVVVVLIGYIIYRVRLFLKHRIYRIVPRVEVILLAEKLQSGDAERIVVADVRSHGYYDPGAERIRGSIRLEPNNLSDAIRDLPKDKDIYVYCT